MIYKKYILYGALIVSLSANSYGQASSSNSSSDQKKADSVQLIPDMNSNNPARALKVMRLKATGIDSAKFSISGLPGICEVLIYDESGMVHRRVTSDEESKLVLDLNHLPAGPYFVRARPLTDNGAIYAAYMIKPQ